MINFVRTQASRDDDCAFSFVDIVSECILLSGSSTLDSAFVPPEVPLGPDDDCSWIHVDPAELDEILLSKSHIGVTQGKNASVDAKAAREKLEQIAAAVDSEDDSDCDSENGSLSESEKVRAQLRSEGAGKMEKIVSGLTGFVERISTLDGADTGSYEVPLDDSVEFNAMLAFSKLGDAVGIEEEELFAAMEQRGWGTLDELLTLKALTDMSLNTGEDIFDGSDDDYCNSDSGDEGYEEGGAHAITVPQSEVANCKSSIADLQTAMDNELKSKACDMRVAGSAQSLDGGDGPSTDDEEFDTNLQPVDIDANLLENIMESIRAQHGEAGRSTAQHTISQRRMLQQSVARYSAPHNGAPHHTSRRTPRVAAGRGYG